MTLKEIDYNQVADTLDTGCDVIEKHGWHAGDLAETPVPDRILTHDYKPPYENGTPLPDTVAVCAMGGVTLAAGYEVVWEGFGWKVVDFVQEGPASERWQRRQEAVDFLGSRVDDLFGYSEIADWNDDQSGPQVVLDTMREAAKDARKIADGVL